MKQRFGTVVLAVFAAVAALAQAAFAADPYPHKPIRMITPAAPGGTTDFLARLVAIRLTDALKVQVVVDNRASASGVIAGEITAHSPPDGYTLFVA